MLEILATYARDHALETEPGFAPKDVRWAIVCDDAGSFLDVVELGDAGDRKNRGFSFPKCPDLNQGELIAGGVTRSHFLADSAEVVARYGPKAEDGKAAEKHAYFVNLLVEGGRAAPEVGLCAVPLSSEQTQDRIRQRLSMLKARGTDRVSFRIGEVFPLQSDTWHEWWRSFRSGLAGKKAEAGSMRCFITGKLGPPKLTHPKIKGLADVGGIASGDVLIGFDKEAFGSYGLSQSANAAVSESAAFEYASALNALIREHSRRLAGAKVVHWFKKTVPKDEDPLDWLEQGSAQEESDALHLAERLLDSIRTGERVDLLDNHYYAMTMCGAAGRVMVRDWMEGRFEDLLTSVLRWFDDLSIVHRDGGNLAASPKFLAVLGAAVRDLKDVSAPFAAKMWRVAVRAEPIPQAALAQVLQRARMDILTNEAPRHARMGLMKAYHIRKHRIGGQIMTSEPLKSYLNVEHPHPAYQCGRLMAVLAGLQRAALGDVGAGLVQRYYAAASATPALVLGRLSRTSQFHLNKLEGGLAHWYESRISEIWGRIKDAIPKSLNLEEQSLFALGYYQQMADLRTRKTDTKPQEKE